SADLGCGVDYRRTRLGQPLTHLVAAGVDSDRTAGADQPVHHRLTHLPGADEADRIAHAASTGIRGPGVNAIGSLRIAHTSPASSKRTGSPSRRKSGSRSRISLTISWNIIRARCEPRQRWIPTPNAICLRLFGRSRSQTSGLSNIAGSRLAAAHIRIARSPCRNGAPWNSASRDTV